MRAPPAQSHWSWSSRHRAHARLALPARLATPRVATRASSHGEPVCACAAPAPAPQDSLSPLAIALPRRRRQQARHPPSPPAAPTTTTAAAGAAARRRAARVCCGGSRPTGRRPRHQQPHQPPPAPRRRPPRPPPRPGPPSQWPPPRQATCRRPPPAPAAAGACLSRAAAATASARPQSLQRWSRPAPSAGLCCPMGDQGGSNAKRLASLTPTPLIPSCSFLLKQGGRNTFSWRRRFFEAHADGSTLHYYEVNKTAGPWPSCSLLLLSSTPALSPPGRNQAQAQGQHSPRRRRGQGERPFCHENPSAPDCLTCLPSRQISRMTGRPNLFGLFVCRAVRQAVAELLLPYIAFHLEIVTQKRIWQLQAASPEEMEKWVCAGSGGRVSAQLSRGQLTPPPLPRADLVAQFRGHSFADQQPDAGG